MLRLWDINLIVDYYYKEWKIVIQWCCAPGMWGCMILGLVMITFRYYGALLAFSIKFGYLNESGVTNQFLSRWWDYIFQDFT